MWVSEVMTTDVLTVVPEARIKATAALLAGHGVTAVPVVGADGRIVGIVSGLDLLRDDVLPEPAAHMIPRHRADEPPNVVADVMTQDVVTVGPHGDVADAVALMDRFGVRSLPVVDRDGKLVGMLSRTDLLRGLARSDEAVARHVAEQLGACLGAAAAEAVAVRVDDGVVTLTTDADPVDRDVAIRAAETVPGVVRVRTETSATEDLRPARKGRATRAATTTGGPQ